MRLESIQTPFVFPHFVMLQPCSKMDSIYTQYPIKMYVVLSLSCSCLLMFCIMSFCMFHVLCGPQEE